MSTLGDVLAAVREVMVMNEKVSQLSTASQQLQDKVADHSDRIVRLETFVELAGGGRRGPAGPGRRGRELPHG